MQERLPLQPLTDSQREILEEAVSQFQGQVTRPIAQYLANRGIDQATATTFRLGVVGTEPPPGFDRYRGMLAIPYLSHRGYPLTVRFRCLQEHDHQEHYHGKYNTMPGDPARIFNVAAVHGTHDEIHVTEGELDAVILSKIGLPAIALPGASSWQWHWRKVLAGFNRVWVWGDPDDAGAQFTDKITRSLRQAKPVRLSDGDVTETFDVLIYRL